VLCLLSFVDFSVCSLTFALFLVLRRGLYGGFLQFRSTIEGSNIASSLNSEENARQCFEASVSAEASGFGFSGAASAGVAGCDATAVASFSSARNAYKTETQQDEIVGGSRGEGDTLSVSPGEAVLLKDTNK